MFDELNEILVMNYFFKSCLFAFSKGTSVSWLYLTGNLEVSMIDFCVCSMSENFKKRIKINIFYSPTNWTMSRLALTPSLLVKVRLSPSKIFIFSLLARPTPTIITETGTNVLAVWTRSRLVSLMSLVIWVKWLIMPGTYYLLIALNVT